jgi:hypothetical protein
MFFSEQDEIAFGNNLYPNALWGAEGGGGPYYEEPLNTYLNTYKAPVCQETKDS